MFDVLLVVAEAIENSRLTALKEEERRRKRRQASVHVARLSRINVNHGARTEQVAGFGLLGLSRQLGWGLVRDRSQQRIVSPLFPPLFPPGPNDDCSDFFFVLWSKRLLAHCERVH